MMKIIDLFNKIANGEEIPEKIKWNNLIYEKSKYNATPRGYYYRINGGIKLWFLDEINSLNDEVEIIEEENKIPEKLTTWYSVEVTQSNEENTEYANCNFETMYEKINEICDYLKSKGE